MWCETARRSSEQSHEWLFDNQVQGSTNTLMRNGSIAYTGNQLQVQNAVESYTLLDRPDRRSLAG